MPEIKRRGEPTLIYRLEGGNVVGVDSSSFDDKRQKRAIKIVGRMLNI